MMRHLIVGLNKKTLYKMSQYFLLNHMNLLEETSMSKWILSNYATKTDLKKAAGVDMPKLQQNLIWLV